MEESREDSTYTAVLVLPFRKREREAECREKKIAARDPRRDRRINFFATPRVDSSSFSPRDDGSEERIAFWKVPQYRQWIRSEGFPAHLLLIYQERRSARRRQVTIFSDLSARDGYPRDRRSSCRAAVNRPPRVVSSKKISWMPC